LTTKAILAHDSKMRRRSRAIRYGVIQATVALTVLMTGQALADDAGTKAAGSSRQVVATTPSPRDRLAPDPVTFNAVRCLGFSIEGPIDRDRLTRDDSDKSLDYLMNF